MDVIYPANKKAKNTQTDCNMTTTCAWQSAGGKDLKVIWECHPNGLLLFRGTLGARLQPQIRNKATQRKTLGYHMVGNRNFVIHAFQIHTSRKCNGGAVPR
eukprot:3921257-Amphidinium_carterae.1